MEPLNGKRLSEAREHILATERSEGAPKRQSKAKERHMHCTLRYGTLLMVPQVGARDRMENVLEYVVIPFTMK